jgi:hypothetical protein
LLAYIHFVARNRCDPNDDDCDDDDDDRAVIVIVVCYCYYCVGHRDQQHHHENGDADDDPRVDCCHAMIAIQIDDCDRDYAIYTCPELLCN